MIRQPPEPPEGHCCPECFQSVGESYVARPSRYGWTYWHIGHHPLDVPLIRGALADGGTPQ